MNVNAQVVLTLDPVEFETIRELIFYVVNENARMTQAVYGQAVAMALKLGVPMIEDDQDEDEDDQEDDNEVEEDNRQLH